MKRSAVSVLFILTLFSLACASGPGAGPVEVTPGSDVRTFSGIAEIGTSFFGAAKSRGNGQFEIGSAGVLWTNERGSDRNISLRPEVISRVWLTCVEREGQNLCLDLGIDTLTGNEHHFRDTNWEGGVNTMIVEAYEHMRTLYPQVQFDRKNVKELD
jgi:hypothetical protein